MPKTYYRGRVYNWENIINYYQLWYNNWNKIKCKSKCITGKWSVVVGICDCTYII